MNVEKIETCEMDFSFYIIYRNLRSQSCTTASEKVAELENMHAISQQMVN